MQSHYVDEGLLRALWRFRLLVLFATLVPALGGYAIATQLEPVYRSSATLYLSHPSWDGVFGNALPLGGSERYPDAAARVLRSGGLLGQVADELGGGTTTQELRQTVSAAAVPDSDAVRIEAEATDPELAAAKANAMVEAYRVTMAGERDARVDTAAVELGAYAADLQQQLADVEARLRATGAADASQVEMLQAERTTVSEELHSVESALRRLQIDNTVAGAGLYRVETAEPADEPVRPKPLLTALVSGFAGLVASSGLAWWLVERSHRRARRERTRSVMRSPELGTVAPGPGTVAGTRGDGLDAAAVAKALRSVGRGTARRSVLVTAALPGQPTAAVSGRLAAGAANAGAAVLLVRPSPGPSEDIDMGGWAQPLPEGRVTMLRPGPQHDPLDIAWQRVDAAEGDGANVLVIVECATLLGSPDGLDLAARVDGVSLLVPEFWPPGSLAEVDEWLRTVGAHVIGHVRVAADVQRRTEGSSGGRSAVPTAAGR